MSASSSINYIIIFIFNAMNHNLMKTATLVYFDNFVKSLASSYCLAFPSFFANFSLVLLIKVLLIKKRLMVIRRSVKTVNENVEQL